MKNYTYDLTIQAAAEADAEAKMKALAVLASSLSARELEKMAHVVKHDPAKTALAKQFLGLR